MALFNVDVPRIQDSAPPALLRYEFRLVPVAFEPVHDASPPNKLLVENEPPGSH